jgi:hypothetical protein
MNAPVKRKRVQAPMCGYCNHRTFVDCGSKKRKCVQPGCVCVCDSFFRENAWIDYDRGGP